MVGGDTVTAWSVAITGGVVADSISAIWRTAHGVVCFEEVCLAMDAEIRAAPAGKLCGSLDSLRADLSAHWTIIYQLADIAIFLCLSACPTTGLVSVQQVLLSLVCLGVCTAGAAGRQLPGGQSGAHAAGRLPGPGHRLAGLPGGLQLLRGRPLRRALCLPCISQRFIQGQGLDWVLQLGSLAFLSSGLAGLALSQQQLGSWLVLLAVKGL